MDCSFAPVTGGGVASGDPSAARHYVRVANEAASVAEIRRTTSRIRELTAERFEAEERRVWSQNLWRRTRWSVCVRKKVSSEQVVKIATTPYPEGPTPDPVTLWRMEL